MSKRTLDIMTFAAQAWLIEREAGKLLLAQLVSGTLALTLDEDEEPVHYADYDWAYYPTAQKPNSTAILSISGVIYDGYVNYLCTKLDLIYADPNVSALVVKINGPGGGANAGQKLADKLSAAPIPTLAYIDYGMAASAHYMVACACDSIWTSRASDQIGSIGTYITYQDWSKYFEKMGVVTKELYAKQSSEKNEESRQAAEGNFTLLQQIADDAATAFIDFVNARRPGILTTKRDPMKGGMFSATEGLENKLIDGIGDLKAAVKALNSTTNLTNTTPRSIMNNLFNLVKAPGLLALKGIEPSAVTAEQVKAVNEEFTALGVTGVAVVSQSELEGLIAAANPTDASALTTANNKITELTNQLSTVTTERNNFEAKAKEYGALNGDEKTTVVVGQETQADAGADDAAKIIANLPHNRALDGNYLFN